MEVTRKNFQELLPEIEKRIKRCNFICVDAEYTGLYSTDYEDANSLFDTPAERYNKLRETVVSKFSICQVGLAFYDRCLNDQKTHFVNAYSFHVFPVAFDSFLKREIISMQVSCLNFLTKHEFDYNKFIKEGVPYLNKEKVACLRKWLHVNRHFMNVCDDLNKAYFPTRIEYLTDNDIEEIIDRLQGFSKIIALIQKYQKPLVGHNMFMDILLVYKQFIGELPQSYFDFKKSVHEIFPCVYDTKCVAYGIGTLRRNEDPEDRVLSDTNLFTLYTNCTALLRNTMKPLIMCQNDTKKYQDALVKGMQTNLESVRDNSCHSADFDAVITGAVLVKLGYMGSRPKELPEFRQGQPPTMTEMFKRLSIWQNEVNIGRCVVSNIHLSQPDPLPKRPDWIRVRCGSKHTKGIDPVWLRGQLAKYGDIDIRVVDWEEVIIASGGIGGARKIWKDLEKRGYRLTYIPLPNMTSSIWSWGLTIGGVVLSIAAAAYIVYRRK